MGKFLEAEKQRLIPFKAASPLFSEAARADGIYRKKPRPFCLPRSHAEENLVPEIRGAITKYFSDFKIKWHDDQNGKPSNHLCSSQVCCANFLFPFADKPRPLVELLRPLYPSIEKMLPMEVEDQFVSIEWIGEQNYLGEKMPRHGKRIRGALFTSADAAVRFRRADGLIQIVLIEWKYTESYSTVSYKKSKSGTDRTKIYNHLYQRPDFPLDKNLLPGFESLFYEPFYQFFRQQALANEMERARELDADIVSLLHIAPAHNKEFQRVTSPPLRTLGDRVVDVWKTLQRQPDRFASTSVEALFGPFPVDLFPQTAGWWAYITARYPWVLDPS